MKNLFVFLVLLSLSAAVYGTHRGWRSQTTYPRVSINTSVTLHCFARGNDFEWFHGSDLIVSNGQLLDNVTDRFNLTCSYPHSYWCNLTILSVNIEDSQRYHCRSFHFIQNYYARITVLALPSVVEVIADDADYVVGGGNLTLTCRVGFVGSGQPYIYWLIDGRRFGSWSSPEDGGLTYPGMSVIVSEIFIVVPLCASYLPTYTCILHPHGWQFYYYRYGHSPNNYTSIRFQPPAYSWTTPKINVAYCPRAVWINILENFKVNSKLSCGSDSYPAAQYQWNIIRGSGFVDGLFFVVDSPGFFNVSCTADNFLTLPDDVEGECAKTVFTTGYVPPKETGDQVLLTVSIALGVLLAVCLIVIILLVAFVISARKRVNRMSDKNRNSNNYVDRIRDGTENQRQTDSDVYEIPNNPEPEVIYDDVVH